MGSEFLVWKNSGKNPRDCLLGKYILEPSHHLYCIFLREHGIHKELTHDRNATAFDTLLHKILLWIQNNGTNYTYISSFFLKDKTLPMMSSPGSISSSPSVQHLQPALQNQILVKKEWIDLNFVQLKIWPTQFHRPSIEDWGRFQQLRLDRPEIDQLA